MGRLEVWDTVKGECDKALELSSPGFEVKWSPFSSNELCVISEERKVAILNLNGKDAV